MAATCAATSPTYTAMNAARPSVVAPVIKWSMAYRVISGNTASISADTPISAAVQTRCLWNGLAWRSSLRHSDASKCSE